MTKRIRAKHKIDRRLGENIWGRAKSPLNKRNSRPGQHGERRAGKLSDYGQQLRAKQKLKGYYANITERQFNRIYKEAAPPQGLDLRAPDRPARAPARCRRLSRQVRADGVRRAPVRQPRPHQRQRPPGQRSRAIRCRVGDVVEVKETSRQLPLVLEGIKSPERDVPDYIEADHNKMTAKLARVPALADVPFPVQMEPNLVVEFYSR